MKNRCEGGREICPEENVDKINVEEKLKQTHYDFPVNVPYYVRQVYLYILKTENEVKRGRVKISFELSQQWAIELLIGKSVGPEGN